jgi:hypothetical protein
LATRLPCKIDLIFLPFLAPRIYHLWIFLLQRILLGKMFWKSVNRRRKPQEKLEVVLKDTTGKILNENEQVVKRWSEYFESLLNVEDDRRAKL